jgi:Calx-beta domain-containing protein
LSFIMPGCVFLAGEVHAQENPSIKMTPTEIGESQGKVRISIDSECDSESIDYRTVDGSAKAGDDYHPASGELGARGGSFVLEVVNDEVSEHDEWLEVRVHWVQMTSVVCTWGFGNGTTGYVLAIIDDDSGSEPQPATAASAAAPRSPPGRNEGPTAGGNVSEDSQRSGLGSAPARENSGVEGTARPGPEEMMVEEVARGGISGADLLMVLIVAVPGLLIVYRGARRLQEAGPPSRR